MWFTYIIKILFGNITTKDPIRVFKWTSFKHSACEFEFWAAAKLNNTFDHKIPSKNVLLLPINCDRFDKFGDTTIDWATENTDSSVARKWNSDQCTNLFKSVDINFVKDLKNVSGKKFTCTNKSYVMLFLGAALRSDSTGDSA